MHIFVGKDYYDCVLAQGHGRSEVFFVRDHDRHLDAKRAAQFGLVPDEINLAFEHSVTGRKPGKPIFGSRNGAFEHDGFVYRWRRVSVVMCGKKHNGLHINKSGGGYPSDGGVDHVFWDLPSLEGWLAGNGLRAVDDKLWWWHGRRQSILKLADYFGGRDLPKQAFDFVTAERIVIATYVEPDRDERDKASWRINGDNLESLQFYKVMDAYTAFQEIEMFVGGVLANPERPTVEITDDKVKLAKHGFDEWSFRKPKAVRK